MEIYVIVIASTIHTLSQPATYITPCRSLQHALPPSGTSMDSDIRNGVNVLSLGYVFINRENNRGIWFA